MKSTQGLLGHARTQTTTDVYRQIMPEGVVDMVDSIHGELWKPSAAEEKRARPPQICVRKGSVNPRAKTQN